MCSHQFAPKETPEEEEEFFYHLTGNRRIVQITKSGESDEQHDEALSLNLYRYREIDSIIFLIITIQYYALLKLDLIGGGVRGGLVVSSLDFRSVGWCFEPSLCRHGVLLD